MKDLIDGIRNFQKDAFQQRRELFAQLAGGQSPATLFITCSDSRICPNLITNTEPGELFVIRNAGNIVAPYGRGDSGEAATIEYAVNALKVRDIVICGHSQCGAMGGLLNPDALASLPAVRNWLLHAEATRQIINENYSEITDPVERLAVTVQENVLVQIQNLKTHPSVAAAISQGRLNLHGWVYQFEVGNIVSYDEGSDDFSSLTQLA